jgi:uncharacterized protein YdhG (YjbR/CyaY superfamily)
MFKKIAPTTAAEYLAAVLDERQELVQFLHEFIQKTAPELKPHFAYNMLGYGSFEYTNYKKQLVQWPVVALANQKNYVSLYVCALENGQHIAEKYQDKLGKVRVGKSCIRINKLEDVNLKTLAMIIKQAAKKPSLV